MLPGAGSGLPLRDAAGRGGGVMRRRGTELTVADPENIFASSMRAAGSGHMMMGGRQPSPTRVRSTEPIIPSFSGVGRICIDPQLQQPPLGRLQQIEGVELDGGGGGHQRVPTLSPTSSTSSSILGGRGESMASDGGCNGGPHSAMESLVLEDRGDSTGTGKSLCRNRCVGRLGLI